MQLGKGAVDRTPWYQTIRQFGCPWKGCKMHPRGKHVPACDASTPTQPQLLYLCHVLSIRRLSRSCLCLLHTVDQGTDPTPNRELCPKVGYMVLCTTAFSIYCCCCRHCCCIQPNLNSKLASEAAFAECIRSLVAARTKHRPADCYARRCLSAPIAAPI
jgi:hypothetical protein